MGLQPVSKIDVEIYLPEGDPGQVGILVSSTDGETLTGQEILDAVSEALLQFYDKWSEKAVKYGA